MEAKKYEKIMFTIMFFLLVILFFGNRCSECYMPNNLYALYCNYCSNKLYENDVQWLLAAILMKFAKYIHR